MSLQTMYEWLMRCLNESSILVIGAGGLGCEILKSLCMSHFKRITVVDMDTISLSNLNRQFLYHREDVGKYKCLVAKERLQQRFPDVSIDVHLCPLESLPSSFYQQFDLILSGLDTVEARLHLNSLLYSLLEYDDKNQLDPLSVHPFIDGGTEGLLGNYRLVIPGYTSCLQCTASLFTKEKESVPLCTIATVPRLSEHCILYARLISFPKDFPDVEFDAEKEEHVTYVLQRAQERADQFHIHGVTSFLVTSTLKNAIPSLSCTNSVIANMMVMQTIKLLTGSGPLLENYLLFNQEDGCSSVTMLLEKDEACPICHRRCRQLSVDFDMTLAQFMGLLEATDYLFEEVQSLHHIQLYYRDSILYASNLDRYYSKNRDKKLSELVENNTAIRIDSEELNKTKGIFYIRLNNKSST